MSGRRGSGAGAVLAALGIGGAKEPKNSSTPRSHKKASSTGSHDGDSPFHRQPPGDAMSSILDEMESDDGEAGNSTVDAAKTSKTPAKTSLNSKASLPPALFDAICQRVVGDKPSREELESLYIDVLSTIDYQFGVVDEKRKFSTKDGARDRRVPDFHIQEAIDYIQEAFELTPAEHQLLCVKAKEKGRDGKLSLKVDVKMATGLKSKDLTGLNDPFCKLGLLQGDHRKATLDQLPEDDVKLTKVCKKTLDPKWNETVAFDLKAKEFEDLFLRLEIWNQASPTKILQSRFLGCVNIMLREIPATTFSEWLPLQGRSGRSHVEGSLHIAASLAFKQKSAANVDAEKTTDGIDDYNNDLQKHELLLQLFVDHEMEKQVTRQRRGTLVKVPLSPKTLEALEKRPKNHRDPTFNGNGDATPTDSFNPFYDDDGFETNPHFRGNGAWNGVNRAANPFDDDVDNVAPPPRNIKSFDLPSNQSSFRSNDTKKRGDSDASRVTSPFDDEDSMSFDNSEDSESMEDHLDFLWCGEMSVVGNDVLKKHAQRKGITAVEESVMWWQILLSKYEDNAVGVEILCKTLGTLRDSWCSSTGVALPGLTGNGLTGNGPTGNGLTGNGLKENALTGNNQIGLDPQQEEMVLCSLREFVDHCLERLAESSWPSAGVDSFQSTLELEQIQFILSCLHVIFSIPAFTAANPKRDLNNELTSLIKHRLLQKESSTRYYEIRANLQSLLFSKNVAQVIGALLELTNFARREAENSLLIIRPTFTQSTGVDHFAITYQTQAKLLAEDLSHHLTELSETLEFRHLFDGLRTERPDWLQTLYQLFQRTSDYVNYVEQMPAGFPRKQLFILNFHDWFSKDVIFAWLDIAKNKAKSLTLKAIKADEGAYEDSLVKYSSSTVDTKCCFEQVIIHNWRQLCWPDLVDSFPFVARVIKDVSEVGKFYALHIYEKAVKDGLFANDGHLAGIAKNRERQMTVAMNNIETVKEGLQAAVASLNFSSIIKGIDASKGELEATCNRQDVMDFVKDAEKNMEDKIKVFSKFIIQQILPKMLLALSYILPPSFQKRGSISEEKIDYSGVGERPRELILNDPPSSLSIMNMQNLDLPKERKFSTFSLKRFRPKSLTKHLETRRGSATSLQSLQEARQANDPLPAPPLVPRSETNSPMPPGTPETLTAPPTPPVKPSRKGSLKNRFAQGIKGVDATFKNSLSGSIQSLSHLGKRSTFHVPLMENPKKDDEFGAEQLLQELETTLEGFSDLLPPNLKLLLNELWRSGTGAMMTSVETNQGAPHTVYEQLFRLLTDIKAIVHANGNGLDMQTILNNEVYFPLEKKLNLLKMSSETMVEQFYKEVIQEQRQGENSGTGILSLIASYNQFNNRISIEILNGKEISLPNGETADVYVKVSMVPKHLFLGMKSPRSNTLEKNRHPLFNLKCEFPVSPEVCRLPYVGVRVIVMHRTSVAGVSQVGTNECCGLVLLSAAKLPGLDGKDGGFGETCLISPESSPKSRDAKSTTQKVARLELTTTRIKEKDTKEMVTVLKARGNHDKVALEFSKDYKKHFLLKERKDSSRHENSSGTSPFSGTLGTIRRATTSRKSRTDELDKGRLSPS